MFAEKNKWPIYYIFKCAWAFKTAQKPSLFEKHKNVPIIFNTGSNFQLRALGCTRRQYIVRVRTQFVEFHLAVEAR